MPIATRQGTRGEPGPLHRFDDFSGGHWGVAGPARAEANQWGGRNVALTRRRGLAPVSAARTLDVDLGDGRVWGCRLASSLDGLFYVLQTTVGSGTRVRRFDAISDPDATAIVVTNCGEITTTPTVAPDWVAAGGLLYLTVWGQGTYVVNPDTPSVTVLTGASGAAPGGRAICVYGDQMIIGGGSDARFGVHPSRIYYTDLTAGAADFTLWEDLAFQDIGGDNLQVRGLYPFRDLLAVVLEDGQVYLISGVLGVNERLRPIHHYDRASGGLEAMLPFHGSVDPAQQIVWLYDHANRTPARFNGAQRRSIVQFGSPSATRAGGADQGAMAIVGGPDDIYIPRVAIPRTEGAARPSWQGVLHLNGAWAAIDEAVLARQET
jgi:hypothetical protein